jgi:hypothetical protein
LVILSIRAVSGGICVRGDLCIERPSVLKCRVSACGLGRSIEYKNLNTIVQISFRVNFDAPHRRSRFDYYKSFIESMMLPKHGQRFFLQKAFCCCMLLPHQNLKPGISFGE